MTMLQDIANDKQATLAQISLAWMLNKKPWIVPIPGTRRVDRLRENAGAMDVSLNDNEIRKIDLALDSIKMSEVFGGSKIVKQ
jgi:aryl-alcohol dehydrogenase-like predicted oxidoreductase